MKQRHQSMATEQRQAGSNPQHSSSNSAATQQQVGQQQPCPPARCHLLAATSQSRQRLYAVVHMLLRHCIADGATASGAQGVPSTENTSVHAHQRRAVNSSVCLQQAAGGSFTLLIHAGSNPHPELASRVICWSSLVKSSWVTHQSSSTCR